MTVFTDIAAAIEEAIWLSSQTRRSHAVYQKTAHEMEVRICDPLSYAMFTAGQGGVVDAGEVA